MVLHEREDEEETANVMGKPQQDRKHRLKHRFEVSKKLGQGTYGKVQLAINKETGQEVAIKTIKKSKIESEQDLVRIRREIQIMSSIQHPHIIHIYEVFENKEKIVLVMQYASGGELYDYLSEKKSLHDVDARRIFRQIAAAVYYCHKNKICHRDLKLENVLLDERGNAKIADFGLSNVFDERHLLGTFCGSPLYASPEIVKGTPYYGPEVDCWSMGVLLYTLVYGAMPFDGSNFKRLVKQISEGDYYEPKKKSEASGLIRRLLTVSPAKRATIIDICTDWWVNLGYEHSLLQVSEDMANLTPVRIDLLLALAPSSPTPPSDAQDAHRRQSKVKDGRGEDPSSSSSFAFISGGMAGDVQQIKAENPDDIFHENDEGSDEEFLSADAAAALEEGLDGYEEPGAAKRRADKSFDGSMMRVSSIAHKTKKPRKSDSTQKQRNSEVQLMQTGPLQHPEVKPEPVPDPRDMELPLAEELVVDDAKPVTATDACGNSLEIVPTVEPEVPSPEAEFKAVEPAQQSAVEQTTPPQCDPPKPSTEIQAQENEKIATQPVAPPSPSKEKKVKRKIISSKKVAAEKATKEKIDTVPETEQGPPISKPSPEKSPVKSKPGVRTSREPSPSKSRETSRKSSLEPKETSRRSSIDNKENVRRPSTDSRISNRRPSVENKENVRRPSQEPRESPRRSSTEPRESPSRRGSVDPAKSPKKAEPPKTPEKPKPLEKPAQASTRKPGKLVIPKFLESPQSTPSPKTAEVKKLVLPIRSVSDAKKAFECKNKSSPSTAKVTDGKKAPAKAETSPTEECKDVVPQEMSPTEAEPIADGSSPVGDKDSPAEPASPTEPTTETEASVDAKSAVSEIADDRTKDTTQSSSLDSNEQLTPEEEEKKKAGAKSILIKSIAKARLTERKLSQQSSLDSETGSLSSPVIGSPVVGSPVLTKTANVPFLKTPKPYVKEDPDNTIKSHAEITLTEKKESPVSSPPPPAESPTKTEEESIWGMPLSSSTDKQIKRSVLSSSIESEMNNWRQEVEESLKRLSPEGASEEPVMYSPQLTADESEAGPAPITRSYKKFTFNKDGTCTTETGKIYTKPENNGTWTKVEKSTKVTTQPGGIPETVRGYREMSPLRHSDSQSSSGSNDVFDDIFDTWTGDSMFGNLMKMNSMFGRVPKDPFRRRDRRRDSVRRPKAERVHGDWARSERRPGTLTDRDSSDNEEDFDVHFDGTDPMSTMGSPNMVNFMRSMNKDFKNHLRAFKERHMPNYSRSLSRDRGDPTLRNREATTPRGRDAAQRTGHSTMTRSVSRDRAQSPPETVLRFVIESPKRQTSVRSEPRGYRREDSWSNRHKLLDSFESDILGKGTRDIGPLSDFSSRFSTVLNSPDPYFDRTSLYGTIRPKAHQRYQKSMNRETPGSPSTPQSCRSGPEFSEKPQYEFSPENRRQRVETWLQRNTGEEDQAEFDPYIRAKTHLQDVPENRVYNPPSTRTYTKYNRSNTELPDLDAYPHLTRDHRSESLSSLEHKREPTVIHYGSASQEQIPQQQQQQQQYPEATGDRDDVRQATGSPDCVGANKPPRQTSQTRVGSPGGVPYGRSMSNTPFKVVTSPESVIEMESPSGAGSPVVRMRVSFNPGGSPTTAAPPPGNQEGIWNREANSRWQTNDGDDSLSLLEALKMRGYRNVITQRFQQEAPREAREAAPSPSDVPSPTPETTQRGKACSYASAETESDACCMDTNPAETAREEKTNGETDTPKKTTKNGEEASDGTLTPDSLESRTGEFKPKNYEEESVSERIRRKSYFLRFNDDRPTRRRSFYRDSDFLPDYRSGLWSRFSVEDDVDVVPVVPRRTNRRKNDVFEKRSSANLDEYLEEYGTKRSDSRNQDDFLSDDGLWGTYGVRSKARQLNGHDTVWYERPGSLWTQRGPYKSCVEPSVVDTVPDLEDRRWTSRNCFSFYSPTSTPKSPVLPHQNLISSDSGRGTLRRSSVNEAGDGTVSEESDSRSRASEGSPGTVDHDPSEILSRAMDLLNQFSQD